MTPDAVSLLEALPDPLAETEYYRQLCRQAFERGRGFGDREGYERARAEQAADWHNVAHPASRGGESHTTYEERRWGPLGREHFANPKPGDRTPEQILARTRASWEPLGLPEPGMVYLAGRVVHYHPPCPPICCSYEPGWYPAEKAAEIVAAIGSAIAERDRRSRVRAAA